MFKAAKPTVPPTFDGVDYDDNKALKAAQDSVIREQWVQSMMARLVREELGKCYYREGVNHLEKCGHLRGKNIMERKHPTGKWKSSWRCSGCGVLWYEMCANCILRLQIATWSSSSTRRSRATCSSSRTTCPRSRFGRSLGRKTRDFWGEGTTRIGMYSMQSGYTQGNVYECPRARGRDFLITTCSHCYSQSRTAMCKKILAHVPLRSVAIADGSLTSMPCSTRSHFAACI